MFIFTNRVEFTGLKHNLLTHTHFCSFMIDCSGVHKTDSQWINILFWVQIGQMPPICTQKSIFKKYEGRRTNKLTTNKLITEWEGWLLLMHYQQKKILIENKGIEVHSFLALLTCIARKYLEFIRSSWSSFLISLITVFSSEWKHLAIFLFYLLSSFTLPFCHS